MQRVHSVDALRGFALFGIAIVNMPFLAAPFGQLSPGNVLDTAVAFAVALLFQGKFFLVFAFLFGWGFGVQEASTRRAGHDVRPRFLRRQAGLLAIGLVHATLVFAGDILMLYAFVGLLLFAVRGMSDAALLRLSGAAILLAAIVLALLAVLVAEVPASAIGDGAGYRGGFAQATAQRVQDLGPALTFIALFNGPLVFAAFCAGLAAQRTGFLEPGNRWFAALKRR